MTAEEQLHDLSITTGETDEAVLSSFLRKAGARIIAKAYPMRDDVTEVPEKYKELQVELAAHLLINRTDENIYALNALLKAVTPFAKVPRSAE